MIAVERILPETWDVWRDGLRDVLIDCVDAGASISFLPPLDRATADACWDGIGAEVNKVLVHTRARRRGIARALMLAIVAKARARGLRLLILDTRADREAEPLYRSLGYREAGRIPDFAPRDGHGSVHL